MLHRDLLVGLYSVFIGSVNFNLAFGQDHKLSNYNCSGPIKKTNEALHLSCHPESRERGAGTQTGGTADYQERDDRYTAGMWSHDGMCTKTLTDDAWWLDSDTNLALCD